MLPVPAQGLSWQVGAPSWTGVPGSAACPPAQEADPEPLATGELATVSIRNKSTYSGTPSRQHGLTAASISTEWTVCLLYLLSKPKLSLHLFQGSIQSIHVAIKLKYMYTILKKKSYCG